MDGNYRKSLVSKIVGKGIITPYEAIHLQHLNNQHRKQQIENLQPSENMYEDFENLQPLVPDYLLKQALTFAQKQDCDLYDAYKWAGADLLHLENAIGEIGFRGLALLNEIKYAKDEWCMRNIIDIDLERPIRGELMEYKVYSRVNQRRMTFTDIIGSLGITLSVLMQSIDIILTDNYYLQNLYDPEELSCLKYLKMWLNEENYDGLTDDEKEEESVPFNLINGCFDHGDMFFIFDNNHPKILKLMRHKIESFGLNLPLSFERNSLEYVKETVKNIVEANPPASLRITDLHEL